MSTSEVLEAMMLGCFSLGWYWSIFAMVWTGKPYGKSSAFVICTIIGYLLGLSARLIDWHASADFSYLIVLYSWNLTVTFADLLLVMHLTRKQAALHVPEVLGFSDHTLAQAVDR